MIAPALESQIALKSIEVGVTRACVDALIHIGESGVTATIEPETGRSGR
jgi:hypothetical protein